MKLKIIIFMFWTLTGEWTKSAAQDTTFCSLKICSESIDNRRHNISIRIELMHCNGQFHGRVATPSTLTVTSSINCSNITTCNRVFRFLQACPITTQVQSNVYLMEYLTSWCQLCPNTITQSPDPPTQTSNDCPVSSQISKLTDERDNLMVAIMSLGVLVGTLVILLAVVITGWVWTCWTMKRNKVTTPEHVRTTQNTAYGVIGPVGNSARAREGQTSATENDYQMMTEEGGGDSGEEHEYHVLEGPGGNTHVHQNRELERREVKESGEEHDYHVLEGPGGDGASKETGVRVVGGVMDYEIPLPLKKE